MSGARTPTGLRAWLDTDTPQSRLVVRGWAAMAEEMVLTWADDPSVMSRDQLLGVLALSLPAIVDLT